MMLMIRKLVFISILLPTVVFAGNGRNSQDSYFSEDKFEHFAFSMFLSASVGFVADNHFRNPENRAAIAGFSVSISAGILKEIIDAGRVGEHSSWKDIAADFVGALAGSVLLLSIK